MRGVTLVAQAKLNLFLRVLGRDASGYHSLETLFQRLDLGDKLTVRVEVAGRSLDSRGADVGPVERNLAWRAALAYADAAGWPGSFAIEIEKRIPPGGGLGGGSADAGAVLRILDNLAPEPLGEPALLRMAMALGADVPFLASDAVRALAWGRGERLLALPALPPVPVALLLPEVGVATADAFRWLAADRERTTDGRAGYPPLPEPRRLGMDDLTEWEAMYPLAENDLERPVAARVPAVAALHAFRTELHARATGAGGPLAGGIYAMTGSGSTWFALGELAEALLAGGSDAPRPPAGVRVVGTRTAAHVVEPAPFE